MTHQNRINRAALSAVLAGALVAFSGSAVAQALPLQIIAGAVPPPPVYPPQCGSPPTGPIYICNGGFSAASVGAWAYTPSYPTGIWIPGPYSATQSRLNFPAAAAAAPDGSVYIADALNNQIRRVDPAGNIWSYAIGFQPTAVAVDSLGNVYYGDNTGQVYQNVQCALSGTDVQGYPTGAGLEGGPLWTCGQNTTGNPLATNLTPFTPNS